MADLTSTFIQSVSIGTVPLEVNFTNTSVGPYVRVEWDFGDGQKSTQVNPSHIYTTEGSYVVKLTVFSDDGSSSSFSRTVTALAESTAETSPVTQQVLFTTKRFDPNQVSVRKIITTGSTWQSTNPFDFEGQSATTTNTEYTLALPASIGYAVIRANSLTGGTTIGYIPCGFTSQVDAALAFAPAVYLAIIMSPTGATSASGAHGVADTLPASGDSTSLATPPVLFYRAVSVNTTTDVITLDRPTPTFSNAASTGVLNAIIFAASGSSYPYGDSIASGHLNFTPDLAVDEAERIFFAGIPYLSGGSRNRRGTLTYLGYTGSSGSVVSLLNVESSSANTLARWYPGTLRITIPWLAWHENMNALGLNLYDSYGNVERDPETGLRYKWLRAGTSSNSTKIAKAYHDLKLIEIVDPEVSLALAQVGNRSWTLPKPTVRHIPSSGGWVSTGISYYWTYRITERNPADGSWQTGIPTSYWGFGEKNSGFPCGYIQRVDVPSGAPGVGYFTVTIPKLNHATGGTACLANKNVSNGFVANWIELYCATGASNSSGPDMTSWRVMTGIPADAAYSGNFANETTIVVNSSSSFRYDISGSQYSWSSTTLSGSSNLHLGNEATAWIAASGNYSSDIYRMSAVCVARNNEFNSSQNSTYDPSQNDSVFITEVGLYNENNDLLMVGKLSEPIEKNSRKFVTVKLELDL